MTQLFSNNASSKLLYPLAAGSLSLTVLGGDGAKFPTPTSPDYFFITLEDSQQHREIVKVTARTSDTFTIERGQEGTVARDFNSNDLVELRLTARFLDILKTGSIGLVLDAFGIVLSPGVKGYVVVPFDCSITKVTLLADVVGTIVLDLWKDTYANFPPTIADSICGATLPTILVGVKSQDSLLTGWTKTMSQGDILAFNINSNDTITRLSVMLDVLRS